MRTLFLAMLFFSTSVSWSSDQTGVLTQLEGDVKLFTQPSKTLQKDAGIHVKYEGDYYLVESARAGMSIEKGNILRTAPGAKARMIYPNGDQFHVGSATAFKVDWDSSNTQIEMSYGKLRGVIEKGGPRSKLMIRTKTATMGVRGTDFFIADGGAGGTEVSIIRGAVEVTSKAPTAKPVEVKSGYSIAVEKETTSKEGELRKTTQQELKSIQDVPIIGKSTQATPPALAELEKKAVQTTLNDIKTHDPKLFAQLQKSPLKSVDDVNASSVKVLMAEAPRAPDKRKPYKSEIEDLEQGAYERYFKNE